MSEKLEPCPFCGSVDIKIKAVNGELPSAVCQSCGVTSGYGCSFVDVAEIWNRRAPLYSPVKPEDVTPGHYWLVTPDGEKTMEQIWDGYGNCGLCIQDPLDGWITVEEIYKWGGMLYSIPPLEVAE